MARSSSPAKVALQTLFAAAVVGLIWTGCTDRTVPTAPNDQAAVLIQNLRPAIDVQTRHNDRLLAIPGVVGTAVGLNEEGRPTIKLFTREPGVGGLPTDLEGVPVKVEVTGMFYARAQTIDPTSRFTRPVPTGVSVGHPSVTAGTIGLRVKDSSGRVFVLSNNHVLANQNDANIGDPALQPGSYDGGSDPADRIGTLYDFEPILFASGRKVPKNAMDAAIALSSTAMLGYATPSNGYGTPGTTIVQPSVGLMVQKYGRTTGLTHGTVSEVNVTVDVCYAGYFFCTKSARFTGQFAITPGTFSGGGDSGSGIVTDDGNANVVGLLFAGSSDRTIAMPIGPVLNRFNVTIDDGSGGGDPPGNNPPSASFTADCTYLACDFDASSSYDSDGTITGYEWDFGDGSPPASDVTTAHTYAALGTYTVTLTVTDDEDASGSTSQDLTVATPGAPGTMHVGDLFAITSSEGKTWSAIIAVLVHDADGNPVGSVQVDGTWSAGPLPVDRCTTEEDPVDGDCLLFSTLIPKKVSSVTFTVDMLTDTLTSRGLVYVPSDNRDADGDSNGTTITVRKP